MDDGHPDRDAFIGVKLHKVALNSLTRQRSVSLWLNCSDRHCCPHRSVSSSSPHCRRRYRHTTTTDSTRTISMHQHHCPISLRQIARKAPMSQGDKDFLSTRLTTSAPCMRQAWSMAACLVSLATWRRIGLWLPPTHCQMRKRVFGFGNWRIGVRGQSRGLSGKGLGHRCPRKEDEF